MHIRTALAVALLALPLPYCLAAYPQPGRPSAPADELGKTLRSFRTNLTDLKHTTDNHESEIRIIEAKLQTQESTVDALRHELEQTTQVQTDLVKNKTVDIESKMESLENTVKGLIADLRQMKTQSNDAVAALGQYKQKLAEIEKLIDAQQEHVANLEIALRSVVDLAQSKAAAPAKIPVSNREVIQYRESSSSTDGTERTYKVQPGDTLDRIARDHKVSVQALKERNSLANDKIVVGQTLRIP